MSLVGRRIVIDADVAGAAASRDEVERGRLPAVGEAARIHAGNCRGVLRALVQHGHTLVRSPTLQLEWRRCSREATRVVAELLDRRRLIDLAEEPDSTDLRALIESRLAGRNGAPAARKDVHLVATALHAGDRRLISNDRKARAPFADLGAYDAVLGSLLWPPTIDETCVAWLESGAPDEPSFRLRPVTGPPAQTS